MKLLTLILLLPIFSNAQEFQLATKSGTTWTFSSQIITTSNNVKDSLGIDSITFTSVSYQTDSVLNLFGHHIRLGTISDVIFVRVVGNKMYTRAAPSGTCGNYCVKYNCSSCEKKLNCNCVCLVGEVCDSQNYGSELSFESIGKEIRRHLIQ